MEIVLFEEKYRKSFIDFNVQWITDYFGTLEDPDKESFDRIDQEIAAGGMIFFATEGEIPLATCMTKPMDDGRTWEICKLASNPGVPHPGAGTAVFRAAMRWALSHGAERLFIITNSKLKAALHIYKKHGFHEVKLNDYGYERGDVALEYRRQKSVVKKDDAIQKVFKGVHLDSLASGVKSQVTKMHYVVGNYAAPHEHPHEQCGYIISGEYELVLAGVSYILEPGDSYCIPGGTTHSFRPLKAGEVIDVFSPPREDYL